MAGGGKDMNASQFYITTGVDLDSLDDKHTIFGEACSVAHKPCALSSLCAKERKANQRDFLGRSARG